MTSLLLPVLAENDPAPLVNSDRKGPRPIPVDPSTAVTAGAFMRAVRTQSPCAYIDKQGRVQVCEDCAGCRRYVEILKRYPYNENIGRDEKAHEVEFDEQGSGDEETSIAAATRQLNQQVYQRWHSEYWSGRSFEAS